jgi:hypothetical protein
MTAQQIKRLAQLVTYRIDCAESSEPYVGSRVGRHRTRLGNTRRSGGGNQMIIATYQLDELPHKEVPLESHKAEALECEVYTRFDPERNNHK